MPETEHIPACAHFGLGVFPYSPVARGLLSGKYKADAPPPEGSRAARQDKRMLQTAWRPASMAVAAPPTAAADSPGIRPSPFAADLVQNSRSAKRRAWKEYVNTCKRRW